VPHVADDRLDESLAEVDRIGQQLNALTVDAPDDGSQQALAGLMMSLGAVRSVLEEVRRAADPAARQSAVDPAQARVAEFERSLGSFRAASGRSRRGRLTGTAGWTGCLSTRPSRGREPWIAQMTITKWRSPRSTTVGSNGSHIEVRDDHEHGKDHADDPGPQRAVQQSEPGEHDEIPSIRLIHPHPRH